MINRDFFAKPIVVLVKIRGTREDDEGAVEVDETIRFYLRREKVRDAQAALIARMTGELEPAELRLKRFANLLSDVPAEFSDFPVDERPLRERAEEYFAGEYFEMLVFGVMTQYDRITDPQG